MHGKFPRIAAPAKVLVVWLSLFAGVSAGQSLEFRETARGTIGRDDDAQLDWEGRLLYLSGVGSAAQLRVLDLKSGVEGKKQVFKDLRKACKEDDRFRDITFAGPEEIVVRYCDALYLIDAENLAVKRQLSKGPAIALRWAGVTKTLVAYGKSTLTVFDGNRWEPIASWPVPEISEMVLSGDGTLIALQLKENRCKFSVRRLPNGESHTDFSVDDCHLPVQLLRGGRGTRVASIQQTSGGAVLTLWDMATGKKENQILLEDSANVGIPDNTRIENSALNASVLASPDWKWIVGNQLDRPHELLAWDPVTGKVTYRSPKPELPQVRGRIGGKPPVPTTNLRLSGDGQSVFVETYWYQIGTFYSVWRGHM